jgi:MFS family permease
MADQKVKNPMLNVLALRDFRLLWIGQGTSFLGDQFAMPWLVLQLTGDPLALGAVLALGGIPRALFMLLGGAITDRFSARAIMLISDSVRLALTLLMAALIFTGTIQVWMLYAFSLLFGIVSGFFVPASNSIVPLLVRDQDLQAGNALFQGTAQLTMFVGPALAGGVIAAFPQGPQGVTIAFVVDAIIDLQKILWKNSTGANNKMDVSLLHRWFADPSSGGYIHGENTV